MVTGFFKKLTNKLFNSSSKFTKDLDDAVNEVSETKVEEDSKKIAHDEKLENNDLKLEAISTPEKSEAPHEKKINQEALFKHPRGTCFLASRVGLRKVALD